METLYPNINPFDPEDDGVKDEDGCIKHLLIFAIILFSCLILANIFGL